MTRHWYDLRVFTRDGQGGNPLAVVPDAVELATETLQKGAAEIGYSETVYLDWSDSQVPKVRIFTPTIEMQFAGHPLIGTVWLLAHVSPMRAVTEIEPPVGRMPCGSEGDRAWIEAPTPAVEAAPDGHGHLVGLGQQYRMVEFALASDVAAFVPDIDLLAAAEFPMGIFAVNGDRAKMRFFAPNAGVDEDPATGSAAVALAALLHSDGRLPEGQTLSIEQGDEVARPSLLEVTCAAGAVRLSGAVAMDGVRHVSI
jgi:trans-2,3-dihydro-3-hydroxyanthranilate isomerase